MNKKIVLGIAGYISSGKTEAGRHLEKMGAGFIEADEVVNTLYLPEGNGYRKIVSYFGKGFLRRNGQINRNKLAKFVFADVRKLKILNGLIHPLVTAEIRRRIGRRKERVVAVEAAYFDKGGLLELVDKVIWIECKGPLLKRRAIKAGVGADMFGKIMLCQRKPEKVDYIVENNGSRQLMFKRLEEVFGPLFKKPVKV